MTASRPADVREARLLELTREALVELNAERGATVALTLDSALDRDLGLDSLARVELILRVERAFGVALPEDTLQRAQSPRDLLLALDRARRVERPTAERRAVRRPTVDPDTPGEATTLPEVLEWHVRRHGERTHIVFLSESGEEEISYAKLAAGAGRVAAALQASGLEPRQAVAIMLPTSPEYFYAYLGILLAGGIPVPIYPPARLSQIEEHVRRHAVILANAQAAILVTVPEAMRVATLLEGLVPTLTQVVTPATLASTTGGFASVPHAADDIAFIQYTSGSTGNPKGVALTHANLLANIRAMARAVEATADDVFVSWLPLYHDMGLIGAWLGSLYVGFQLVVMSPLTFLAGPERWLWAIHRFRGTLSAAPNFAYELTLRRAAGARLDGLDLSSWRLAFNGAEAVSPDTIARFSGHFARFGLRSAAMTPVYGLAECSVGLLFPPLDRGPLIDRIERDAFVVHGKAVPASDSDPHALQFPSCGRPLPGHQVRIVDASDVEVGERVEGALQFKGPSATRGYFRNPEGTQQLFHGEWLDSGDRAYRAGGEFYVTGRVKDMIIRRGRNIHPAEVEEAVGAVHGVRTGCVAVFGALDSSSGTERLVVLAETRESSEAAREALRQRIAAATVDVIGEPPDEIVLAPPHSVLKTSSGKVRRSATRERFEAGVLGARTRSVPLQLARLALGALVPKVRRRVASVRERAYGIYAALLLLALAVPTWLIAALTPDPQRAWAISGRAARLFFRLARIPFAVHGLEHLPRDGASVLVINHASYLDGVVLVAALPRPYRFVAKRELGAQFVAGTYLRRLGTEFVERFDAEQSVQDAERLAALPARGESLAIFPEGTFTRTPALMPFRLGAFVAAARSGVPVVPVALRGTRTVLGAGHWLPRPGAIVVTVSPSVLPPAGEDTYTAALALRDQARAAILRGCGERDAA